MVSGLFKTAQGALPGVATTLVPAQDAIMKLEAMRCLVAILRSMGDWMNKQMRIPDAYSSKLIENISSSAENISDLPMVNGIVENPLEKLDSETVNVGVPEAASLEQRLAYKLELQVGLKFLLCITKLCFTDLLKFYLMTGRHLSF